MKNSEGDEVGKKEEEVKESGLMGRTVAEFGREEDGTQ